jgi:Flagellar protein FliT
MSMSEMDESLKAMMLTLKQFRAATESQDWEQVSELDSEFRGELERVMSTVPQDEDTTRLVAFLERADAIYELVKAGAKKNREEISKELGRLSKEQKAAASYEQSARWI